MNVLLVRGENMKGIFVFIRSEACMAVKIHIVVIWVMHHVTSCSLAGWY
jgi:hypothetical protein